MKSFADRILAAKQLMDKGLVDDRGPWRANIKLGQSGAIEINQAQVLQDGEKVTKGLSALPGSDID